MQSIKFSSKSYEQPVIASPEPRLPKPIWILIASFLPTPKDLSRLSLTSKYFLHLLNKNDQVWKNLAKRLFPSNSISENIKDHKQFIKNQTCLFKNLPDFLDKKSLKKLKDLSAEIENQLCPFKPEKAEMGYTVVWREEDKTELLCCLEKKRLLFRRYNPENQVLSKMKIVNLSLTEDSKQSDISCAYVAGKILCLGINYKVDTVEENFGIQKEIKLGMVVLINKKDNSLITSVEKQCKDVMDVKLSESGKMYVKIQGAKKPWYCYNLNNTIKKHK